MLSKVLIYLVKKITTSERHKSTNMWGQHNLEGEWSTSKKKGNDQRTPSLSLEKLPLFVHMLRGFFLTVCECWPDASGRRQREGWKKTKHKETKDMRQATTYSGKISQSLLLRIMSKLCTQAYTALAVSSNIPESWVTLYTDNQKQHSKETW